MNSTHLIIKSRTVAAQLRKTNPGAAQKLSRLVDRWEGIASMQAQIKEDIKAVAEHLGGKPAQVSKIIALVEKEREKGDVISGERDIIDAAEEMAAQA